MSESTTPTAPSTTELPARRPYEAPRVTSSSSLEQVTLFSGTVTDGGIIFGD